MNTLYETFVAMEPVAKGRPRVTKIGAFTPTKTKNAEARIQIQASQEYKEAILEGPLDVSIGVHLKRPASKKKNALPTTRPDLDNYAKLVMDALNGIIWKDDSQIINLNVFKQYSDTPGFRILVFDGTEMPF